MMGPASAFDNSENVGLGKKFPTNFDEDDIQLAMGSLLSSGIADHLDQSVIRKILRGEYVELSKLLPPTLTEIQKKKDQIGTLGLENGNMVIKKDWDSKEIKTFPQWSKAFEIFMAVYLLTHPEENLDLLSYTRYIRNFSYSMSLKGVDSWIMYDRLFRLKKSKMGNAGSWGVIDWELYALHILLPLGSAPDKKIEPGQAKNSNWGFKKNGPRNKNSNWSRQGKNNSNPNQNAKQKRVLPASNTPCRNFNSKNGCGYPSCAFAHVCRKCRSQTHSAVNCNRNSNSETS